MIGLLTFPSVHYALAAERRILGIEGALWKAELVPLPPSIKSDCGFALRIETDQTDELAEVQALKDLGLSFVEAYKIQEPGTAVGNRKERRYERIG